MSKIDRALGLFFLLGALGQLVSAAPPLPNVVIIYADDMGYPAYLTGLFRKKVKLAAKAAWSEV